MSILEVKNLSKQYHDSSFALKDVSFTIPYGTIVGFIGENGAGKSTTMGAILGTLQKDDGSIHIFGEELTSDHTQIREDIGFVFDDMNLPKDLTISRLGSVFEEIYQRWDQKKFEEYVTLFSLPDKKKLSSFSRGMSMKLAIAVALSHHAKLLILDEATGGLDPSGRDEVLSVLRDFVSKDERGILLSSHITSDIEKIADALIFIKNGEIILEVSKSELKAMYAILECLPEELDQIDERFILAKRENKTGWDVLVTDESKIEQTIKRKPYSIDDMTLLLMRGDKQ
ncbi:ABC transporter ATP-binding protein [Alkalihalobacillus sp. NPDC078783]